MRGVYTAVHKISGLTAAKTLMYITAPSGRPVEVLATRITNCNVETNEQMEQVWQRISTLGTPTGTSKTPSKHEDGDQASASTVVANITASEPTYASNSEVWYQGSPSLTGYDAPRFLDQRFLIQGGASWGLRHLATIASADIIIEVVYREMG